MKWLKVESNTRPEEVDAVSCPEFVYYRRNIEEVPAMGLEGEESGVKYVYEEAQVTRADYETMQSGELSPSTKMIMQTISNLEMQNEMIMIAMDM